MDFVELLKEQNPEQLKEAARTLLDQLNATVRRGGIEDSAAPCFAAPLLAVLTELKARNLRRRSC